MSTRTNAVVESERPAPNVASRPGRVELIISLCLRYGVLVSCVLIIFGTATFFLSLHDAVRRPTLASVLSASSEGTMVMRSPTEVLDGLTRLDPSAVIALGLLVLMSTPVVPIVLSAVSFFLDRDGPFLLITLLVLSVLTVGFLLGASG